MWFILGLKGLGVIVIAFSRHIVNWLFDAFEYFEDKVKNNRRKD